jgi:hypothetical protein
LPDNPTLRARFDQGCARHHRASINARDAKTLGLPGRAPKRQEGFSANGSGAATNSQNAASPAHRLNIRSSNSTDALPPSVQSNSQFDNALKSPDTSLTSAIS